LQNVLEHDFVEGQIRHEALELGFLVPQRFEFPRLKRRHTPVDLLPSVVALLGDSVLPAELRDRRSQLRLLQNAGDSARPKIVSSSGQNLRRSQLILPQNLTLLTVRFFSGPVNPATDHTILTVTTAAGI